MSQVCILTDSTAQFPTPAFAGRNLVNVIPLHVQVNGTKYEKSEGIRAADLPASMPPRTEIQAFPPSIKEFEDTYTHLGQFYEEIVGIFHTSDLSQTLDNAKEAAALSEGQMKIVIIDALTTATGLGLVVQAAAAAAEDGANGPEIDDMIRSLLPRMYSVFCIQGLSYLHHSDYLGEAQAIIGEYLQVLPIYTLEGGKLAPTQKARNNRHLVDLLHEFLCEFTELEHIALLQGTPPFENETRALRERLQEDFGDTPISEHTISPELASIIGPRTLGMFALQSEF